MMIKATSARKASKALVLACTIWTAVWAAHSDLSGGFWQDLQNCVLQAASILPAWLTAVYAAVAAFWLFVCLISFRLKWGIRMPNRRVTLMGIVLFIVSLPCQVMVLAVAWPILLCRVTVFRTR